MSTVPPPIHYCKEYTTFYRFLLATLIIGSYASVGLHSSQAVVASRTRTVVESATLLLYPSVTSRQHASLALPSCPIARSPVVQYAGNIFVGCRTASDALGDIVAVDVTNRYRLDVTCGHRLREIYRVRQRSWWISPAWGASPAGEAATSPDSDWQVDQPGAPENLVDTWAATATYRGLVYLPITIW